MTRPDATPPYTCVASKTWPCGDVGHDQQIWENEEEGVLWCPACGRNSLVAPPVGEYLHVLNEQISDSMAESGIPQKFWPPQVIQPNQIDNEDS